MLSPMPIDYDPSNGSWNVFAIEIAADGERWELQPYAFQSLGHAMNFAQSFVYKLEQEKPGGMWYGDLRKGTPFKGYRLRIAQLVMVTDGKI